MKRYMPVVNYISANASRKYDAIIGSKIASACGINCIKLRQYVNEARSDGLSICSYSRGYYYSTRSEDVDDTIRHLKGRISKVESAIEGLSGARVI